MCCGVDVGCWCIKDDSGFAFPRYTDNARFNANSASAALNEWLKQSNGYGCVMYSFRHAMRDRLRAVSCPSEMIDQIGGWSSVRLVTAMERLNQFYRPPNG